MTEEKDVVKVPEDTLGTGDGSVTGKVNPAVEKDPEVIAEEKKLRLSELRWKRYIISFKGIAIGLQTFKAEAISLVSGIGTLVLGWYQLKKWVLTGRKEVNQMENKSLRVEATAVPLVKRESRDEIGHTSGAGYGSSSANTAATASRRVKPAPTPAPTAEVVTMTPSVEIPTIMMDPQIYLWIGLLGTFVWSSWKSWLKKKNKQLESGGQ